SWGDSESSRSSTSSGARCLLSGSESPSASGALAWSMALTPSCARLRHRFGQENPAENEKIESENPLLPGMPGQVARMPSRFGADAAGRLTEKRRSNNELRRSQASGPPDSDRRGPGDRLRILGALHLPVCAGEATLRRRRRVPLRLR